MQLDGLDASLGELGAFDISSIFTSVGKVLQKQAPALVQAAVDQRIAKLQAKPAAPAQSPSVAVTSLQPSARTVPVQQSNGIDKRWLIGGGLAAGVVLLVLVLRG